MSLTVRIPTQLRTLTGGAGEVQVEGSTVGEALKALDLDLAGAARQGAQLGGDADAQAHRVGSSGSGSGW